MAVHLYQVGIWTTVIFLQTFVAISHRFIKTVCTLQQNKHCSLFSNTFVWLRCLVTLLPFQTERLTFLRLTEKNASLHSLKASVGHIIECFVPPQDNAVSTFSVSVNRSFSPIKHELRVV